MHTSITQELIPLQLRDAEASSAKWRPLRLLADQESVSSCCKSVEPYADYHHVRHQMSVVTLKASVQFAGFMSEVLYRWRNWMTNYCWSTSTSWKVGCTWRLEISLKQRLHWQLPGQPPMPSTCLLHYRCDCPAWPLHWQGLSCDLNSSADCW